MVQTRSGKAFVYEFLHNGGSKNNGCSIGHYGADGVRLQDFLDGLTLKICNHFTWLCGADTITKDSGGVDVWAAEWDTVKAGEALYIAAGESIRLRVHDNLSGLDEFYGMIQGLRV